MKQNEIETPALLVDQDIAERNIQRFQAYAAEHGLAVRPHIKTHKLPLFARRQLEAGAVGITCQKTSEAEAMIEAEPAIRDVLITYNILGEAKLARLRRLAERVTLSVTADSATTIDGLSAAFADAGEPLRVLVECDTGAGRCGVTSPGQAAELAQRIDAAPGLTIAGLMTYPPVGGAEAVQSFMTEAKALIEAAGLRVETITSGGTPDMMKAHLAPVVTEHRPGTYIYNDRSLVNRGVCGWDDCALTILATVVSVPTPHRAVIDAGSKTLTSDLLGATDYGHVLGRPDISIDSLSEEHGRLVTEGEIGLKVGDRIRIVPNHVCVTVNMVDAVYLGRGGEGYAPMPVTARGRIV